jgi:hypothetical protein
MADYGFALGESVGSSFHVLQGWAESLISSALKLVLSAVP